MSRRQILADIRQARGIRRLQEQSALQHLQAQQLAVSEAGARLEALEDAHRDAEAAWAGALEHPVFDAGMINLWRARTGMAKAEVLSGEQMLAKETGTLETRREAWAVQLRLLDAAETVTQAAARKVRQADDEHRLQTAEDALRFRRRA